MKRQGRVFIRQFLTFIGGCVASPSASFESDSPENNNYLRVSAAFGQRRLSDNVLNAPGHRRQSGNLGSDLNSSGSAPNTPISYTGLPVRRHSSAFAQNRRFSSNALLSPATASQVSKKANLYTRYEKRYD